MFQATRAHAASLLPIAAQAAAAALWLPALIAARDAGFAPVAIAALAGLWLLSVLAVLLARPRVARPGARIAWFAANGMQALAWGIGGALLMPAEPPGQVATLAILVALFAGPDADGPHASATLVARAVLAVAPACAVLFARAQATPALLAAGALIAAGALLAARLHRQRAGARAHERIAALEASLAEQARAAEGAREQAQASLEAARRANHDKTRFLAAASHDLRQPVHAIGLFVGALKEEIREGRARYLIDRLDRSMAGLDELFNRLLDISRLDAGAIEPKPSVFAITPVLQTLETRFAPLAEQRALKFRVRPRPGVNVRTDAALLVEMLMNLLSNAFRYTDRGGILLGTRLRGDRLTVQVWDTGAGIAPGDIGAIFDEFVQIGNGSRDRRHGLGLGLAIVRRLGQVLDCPVAVRSRPGRGTVFEVSVPISRQPAASAPAPRDEAAGEALRGMLVLVVDDELDILVGMEAILAAWGCYVLLARSVAEASRHLDEALRFPDALITDHRLGAGDTSEDVVAMVERTVPVPVPVILISGEVGASLQARVRERGWPLLSKPVNPERLRALLVEIARAQRAQG